MRLSSPALASTWQRWAPHFARRRCRAGAVPVSSLVSLFLQLILWPVSGCADEPASSVLDARIVTADGSNPFALGVFDHLSIVFDQAGLEPQVVARDLEEATFDIPLELDVGVRDARIRVVLSGPDAVLHGAPPAFTAVETFGFLRVVVGVPGTCALSGMHEGIDVGRVGSGFVRRGNYIVQLGGVSAAGPSGVVSYWDLLWSQRATNEPSALEMLPGGAGLTRAILLGDSRALVVSQGGGPWTYHLFEEPRTAPLALHAGADHTSALARLPEGRVVVLGGGAESPMATGTLVSETGPVGEFPLQAPRSEATAVTLNDGTHVLLVGGATDLGELVDSSVPRTEPIDAEGAEPVTRPLVVVGHQSIWVLGGRTEAGISSSQSWVVEGCPEACIARPGPTVDLSTEASQQGEHIVDGTRLLRAVEGDDWSLDLMAELNVSRRDPGIAVYESGIVWIHGGDSADGPRRDTELCFPNELTPLAL